MARLYIGLPQLTGKLAGYAKRFDLLELGAVDQRFPSTAKLRAWRAQVPPSFAFTVVVPEAAVLAGDDEAVSRSIGAARVLEARTLLLITSPAVRPTQANRERIARVAARLPNAGHLRCWEARGLWTAEEVMQTASEVGVMPVFDAAEQPLPPGPVAYTRIRALGKGRRLGSSRLERIALQLAGRREAYVVVDREIAAKLRRALPEAVARAALPQRVPPLFRPREPVLLDDEEQ